MVESITKSRLEKKGVKVDADGVEKYRVQSRNSLSQMPIWFLPVDPQDAVPSAYTVVFSYDATDSLVAVKQWLLQLRHELEVNVLCYEYTGYGAHQGTSSFTQCVSDLKVACDFAIGTKGVPRQKLILYGQGLGAVVALALAEQLYTYIDGFSLGAVVAESCLISDVIVNPAALRCPVVFVHGDMHVSVALQQVKAFAHEFPEWTVLQVRGGMPPLRQSCAALYLPSVQFFKYAMLECRGSTFGLSRVLRGWLERRELLGWAECLAAQHIGTVTTLFRYCSSRPRPTRDRRSAAAASGPPTPSPTPPPSPPESDSPEEIPRSGSACSLFRELGIDPAGANSESGCNSGRGASSIDESEDETPVMDVEEDEGPVVVHCWASLPADARARVEAEVALQAEWFGAVQAAQAWLQLKQRTLRHRKRRGRRNAAVMVPAWASSVQQGVFKPKSNVFA
eukprot:TRINITY_DN1682_c0_g1_i3.p1 TRINITY_DN1682_c0_g1~~TRINITY_DN1682_c0_g1_i3.p1  ORF type:complete len:452 (+),score=93.22 TRINITY_DN1682_c0_g1_i3:1601-2956(+)